MPAHPRSIPLVVLLAMTPLAALANPYKDNVEKAAYALQGARNALRSAPTACREVLAGGVKKLAADLADLRDVQSESRLDDALASIGGVVVAEDIGACPAAVSAPISDVQKALTSARESLLASRVAQAQPSAKKK